MYDHDAMKPKFSFVEITTISKVSSISVIKCERCSSNTIRDSTQFLGNLGIVFNRLPCTCRHKLSTSFAVMDGIETTVLLTSFDGLSLISSVAILSRLLLAVYISFLCSDREGRLCSLPVFRTSCSSISVDRLAFHPLLVHW